MRGKEVFFKGLVYNHPDEGRISYASDPYANSPHMSSCPICYLPMIHLYAFDYERLGKSGVWFLHDASTAEQCEYVHRIVLGGRP